MIRNVELPLRWRGIDRAARRAAALAALERLNVASLADRKALSLSGGEAQRVSLARALAIEPQLLLLDEPAAGLDAEARRAFFDDLERALSDRSTTVVHVSHRAEEALRLADRSQSWRMGRSGRSTIRRQSCGSRRTRTVARLVGYENVLPVQIDGSGQVLIGGAPCGVPPRRPWLRDARRLGNGDPPGLARQRPAPRDGGTRIARSGTLGGRARRQRDTARPPAL